MSCRTACLSSSEVGCLALTGVCAGLAAATRSTTTASASRARSNSGPTSPTPRSGRNIRSRRACARSATTTT